MSKVVKIKSQLKKEKNNLLLGVALTFILSLVFSASGLSLLLAIMLQKSALHISIPVIFIVSAFLGFVFFINIKKKYDILKSGVRGEENTLKLLKKLPGDYTVITNPVIHNRGITMELDFVVIGKNGVFIVESKNYRGAVCGKTSGSSWKQIKYGKNGKTYEKEVSNPARQSYRQKQRLSELFRDMKINVSVFSVLYFVDSRTELRIQDDADLNIAIINNEKVLLEFIKNTKGKDKISSDELVKIIRQFKK